MVNKIESIYPLSPMQEGMLYHKLLRKNSTEYFIRYVIKFNGKLETNKIRESLDLLADKYEVLRTAIVIPKKSDRPLQVVLRDRRIELNIVDLTINEQQMDRIEQIKLSDLKRGFDLQKDSLLRLTIIKLSSEKSIVLWSLHHIILDGWCSSSVIADFINIYVMLSKGKSFLKLKEENKILKTKVPSYGQYIKWLESQDKEVAIKYWKELLKDYSNISTIVSTKKNINVKEEMDRYTLTNDKKFTDKINNIAKINDITVNTILESALGILLQRYNKSNDVVFGKVVSGRNADIVGIDRAVGLFINTIPVRVKVEEGTTCKQLLKEMHNQAIDSSNYDYCSLSEIQNQSNCGNDLIKIIFVYENFIVDKAFIKGGSQAIDENLEIEIQECREQTNYPINVSVSMSETLNLSIIYDPRLFRKAEIKAILDKYNLIIHELLDHPEKKIGEIDVINKEEREKIINEFNETEVMYPKDKTVADLFEKQVCKVPDKIAVSFEEKKITYKELNEKANELAVKLRNLGIKPDDYVAIMAEKRIETIIGICGIVKAGAAYVPIDPAYPKERTKYILEDCKPKVILLNKVKYETDIPSVDISKVIKWKGIHENVSKVNNPSNLIYLIYTSGTTGKPKGVMIEHKNVIRLVCNTNYAKLDENTVILQTGSLSFDAATFEIWGALLNGGKVCLAKNDVIMDAKLLKRTIQENKINTMFITTSLFNQLISSDKTVFNNLNTLLFGGEKTSEMYVRKLIEVNKEINFANVYGPTETTTFATYYSINDKTLREKTPIGKPISNTKVYVLNGTKLCGIGMTGELCIGGDGVARGYLNKAELTAEKFIDNPFGEGRLYRSGDLVRWLPDGNIEFLGRIDDQIKLRGFRIELSEIENVIRKQAGIQNAAVILKEKGGEKYICAYVVSENNVRISDLRNELEMDLPSYMIPSRIMQIKKIPVTTNGKLDKKALPEIEIESEKEYIAPRNKTEEAITKVFEEVLGIEKIGIKDNFYELGGDSLKVIRIVSKLRELNYDVTIREIIQKKTIEQVVNLIETCEEKKKNEKGEVNKRKSGNSTLNWINQDDNFEKIKDNGVKKTCKSNNLLDVSTVAVLKAVPFDQLKFEKTILFKELMKYDDNRKITEISECFEPFAYQKFFLVKHRKNICCAKTKVIGEISQKKLISLVKQLVKEQSIFRYSYNENNNCFQQYKYTDNWYIPYIDISNSKNISNELEQLEAVFNMYPCFKDDRLLLKVIIIKVASGKHLIYYYVHHSVWDVSSAEALDNCVKNKFLGIKDDTIADIYTEYTKKRRSIEKGLESSSYSFLEKFNNQFENYRQLIGAENLKYFIDIRNNINECMLQNILKNPIKWSVQLFSMINIKESNDRKNKTFPVIQIQSARNKDDELNVVGLHLDFNIQIFDANSGEITPVENDRHSFILFEPEIINKEINKDYFKEIPTVNFVTIYNSLYQPKKVDKCEVKVIDMPEKMMMNGYISVTIVNDVIHLMIPSLYNDMERISKIVKGYLK